MQDSGCQLPSPSLVSENVASYVLKRGSSGQRRLTEEDGLDEVGLEQGVLTLHPIALHWQADEACGPFFRKVFLNVQSKIHRVTKEINSIFF